LPALSVTVVMVPDANIAINMFPVPVAATVTAHDAEVEEQEVPPVALCTGVIVACAPMQNSRLRTMAFMPALLPSIRRNSTGVAVIAGTSDQEVGSRRQFIYTRLSAEAIWIPPTFWLDKIHITFVGSQAGSIRAGCEERVF
jgi:hypothetical protein